MPSVSDELAAICYVLRTSRDNGEDFSTFEADALADYLEATATYLRVRLSPTQHFGAPEADQKAREQLENTMTKTFLDFYTRPFGQRESALVETNENP